MLFMFYNKIYEYSGNGGEEMLKAIVYESNTGYTRHYAEILSGETGLPAYELKASGEKLTKGEEIIFMGWIMAGSIKGYKKAAANYSIRAACAVGMGSPSEKVVNDLTERHQVKDARVFCLQGGFDINKLHGMYKFMMKMMGKSISESIEKKEVKTPEDIASLEMFRNGGDYVKKENLADVIKWYDSVKA